MGLASRPMRLFRPGILFLVGSLLLVIGAKLALVRSFGSDVPYADQWTAEGSTLFQPKLRDGRVPLEHFFFPHGEHRPAMTRFIAYGLFRANGNQWDARLECVANLSIHVGTFLLLWWLAGLLVSGRWLVVARLWSVAVCALPSIHENFVWGFQSQFLLLVMAGLAHVAGTLTTARPGWRWWGAQLAGLCGVLSLASGFLSAVALLGLALALVIGGRRDAWAWATLTANAALAAFGLWFLNKIYDTPDHVHSVTKLAMALADLLAWPAPRGYWGLLGQLPLFVAVGWAFFRRRETTHAWLLLGLAAWLGLLTGALAFGRGGGQDGILVATRYMDILVIGSWLNLMATLWLGCRLGMRRGALMLGFCLLPVLGGLGYWNLPGKVSAYGDLQRDYIARHDAVVHEFLQQGDPQVFERDPVIRSAFPHLSFTVGLLKDPVMQPAWPPSLQPDGRAGWLSQAARGVVHWSRLLVVVGLGLTLIGGFMLLKRGDEAVSAVPS